MEGDSTIEHSPVVAGEVLSRWRAITPRHRCRPTRRLAMSAMPTLLVCKAEGNGFTHSHLDSSNKAALALPKCVTKSEEYTLGSRS